MKKFLLFLGGITLIFLGTPVAFASSAVVHASAFPTSAAIGSTIPVDILIDTNGNNLQAAQVQLTFSSNLTYTSFTSTTSAFDTSFIDPEVQGTTIMISRGTLGTTPITGNSQEFIHLIFTLNASGVTSLNFTPITPGTELVAPDSSDVPFSVSNIQSTITAPPVSTPTPTPTPKPKSTPSPTPVGSITPTPTPSPTPTSLPTILPTRRPVTPTPILTSTPTAAPTFLPAVTASPTTTAQVQKAAGISLVILGIGFAFASAYAARHH